MRIDFYLLENATKSSQNTLLFICRLIDKAYQKKHQVYVYLTDKNLCKQLNDLLWTFQDSSFIPHQEYAADSATSQCDTPNVPVLLSCLQPPGNYNDILVNLSDNIPIFYQKFARAIEIVPVDEEKKARAPTLLRLS